MSDDRRDDVVEVQPGADVYGTDGERLGAVIEVSQDYVVVEKGVFFPTDYFIPMSAIATAEAGRVTLDVTRDEAMERGWDRDPGEQASDARGAESGLPATSGSGESAVAADDAHHRDGDPVTSGMGATLGTIPPAADFNTLGVAAVDVDADYTEEGRPAGDADPAPDDTTDPAGRPG